MTEQILIDKAKVQQALEALRKSMQGNLGFDEAMKSFTALRQALEQQPADEPVAWHTEDHLTDLSATTYKKDVMRSWQDKGWPVTPLYTHPKSAPIQLRRGDILRCIETDELCTVWATSTTHKTLVKWSGNDFTDYTAEQIGELFWLEPESEDVEIAAEQSDNYAAFHAGVRFANTRPQPAAPEFYHHVVKNEGDWSEWVNPDNDSYMMKCCDCGLVHEMQFKVAKYSEGDECEFVNDPDLQPVFRARRAEEAWQEKDTAHRAGGLPQPCPTCEALARTVMLDQTSHDTATELLKRCENEMRYAGWGKFESDNTARNGVYEQVKHYLEKNA